MTQTEPWRAEIEAFVQAIEGKTQEEAAALDPAFNQRDISRWKAGNYKQEPSGPKMAGIKRVLAEHDPTSEARREAYRIAAEEVEAVAAKLRTLATQPSIAASAARVRESSEKSKDENAGPRKKRA